jgi:hypothetical protein
LWLRLGRCRSDRRISMGALTPVVGLRKGIRERIYNRETSRLSRRCTTANFLRAVLLRA